MRSSRLFILPVVLLFAAINPVEAVLTTNSWTNSVSSKWETPGNWSLGVAPTNTHAAILITNATSKIVTIDATTPASTLTISNLIISGPAGTVNTLQITNAPATTLKILNWLTISSGGALAITNSMLNVSNSIVANGMLTSVGGTITTPGVSIANQPGTTGSLWVTGSRLIASNGMGIGSPGVGQMTLSNSTWYSYEVGVGGQAGSQGTLTMVGGTNNLAFALELGIETNSTGTVWLLGGELNLTNTYFTSLGYHGVARMTVSNGLFRTEYTIVGHESGSQANLMLAGGTTLLTGPLHIGFALNSTGTVWLTGGQLILTNISTFVGDEGVGAIIVSNGNCRARNITLATTVGSRGSLTVAGGVLSVYSNLTVGLSPNCSSTGIVTVTGGALRVTNNAANAVLEVRSGTLTQSGGTLDVDRLVITNECAHIALTGGTLIYGILDLSTNQFADADGDGMSNNYELEHGLDPLDPTDAGLDYDNDGQNNLQEHEMNTDPYDANSYFHISSIIVTNKNVLITWNTATMTGNGLSFEYYVLWGTNLTGGVTNNLAGVFVVHGTPITSTNYLDVGGATNRPPRFYRILGRPNIG